MNREHESTLDGSRRFRSDPSPEACIGEQVPPWLTLQKSCSWTMEQLCCTRELVSKGCVCHLRAPWRCFSDPALGGGVSHLRAPPAERSVSML